MPKVTRRSFIAGATAAAAAGVAGTGAVAAAAAETAATAGTAQAATSGLGNIQHVIVFMQENRSFDHYYGTLQGVRGFSDRTAISLPSGSSVFNQPNGSSTQYPWQLTTDALLGETLGQCNGSLDHSWATQHQAFDGGRMDDWVAAKGSDRTMGYLARADIPFHYALADAYTILDAYHCSVLSATGPNRTYLWSGMIDPDGTAGGPAYDGGSESGLSYPTYAQELQAAGISWKVYQAYDNYGDNALEYFDQFQGLSSSSPLYPGVERTGGSSGDIASILAAGITADLKAGTFPQVSYIVTNQQYSEHPYAPPNDGAHCINLILQALAAYPSVFNSSVLFLNYDENDGLFDHVPPPVAPAGTALEYIPGANSATENLPIGLGFRVPMTIISPWTRGGRVSSELADHTSVLQFMEQWSTAIGKPALCGNISPWRREVCSDLVDMFDFASPVTGLPSTLPSTSSDTSFALCAIMVNPSPTTNALPSQEPGTRPALALPYQANATVTGFGASATSDIAVSLELANAGNWAASATHFWVYANSGNPNGPWPYTVAADSSQTATVDIGTGLGAGAYNLTLIGPNRFRRDFKGNSTTAGASVSAALSYQESVPANTTDLLLTLANGLAAAATFTITPNHYTSTTLTESVAAGATWSGDITAACTASGWYDFTITVSADPSWSQRFTGHLENGLTSITG